MELRFQFGVCLSEIGVSVAMIIFLLSSKMGQAPFPLLTDAERCCERDTECESALQTVKFCLAPWFIKRGLGSMQAPHLPCEWTRLIGVSVAPGAWEGLCIV